MIRGVCFSILMLFFGSAIGLAQVPTGVNKVPTGFNKPVTAFEIGPTQVYSNLLQKYVKESADGVNRVDYAGWKSSPRDILALRDYIGSLADTPVDTLPREAQFALWINAYNAITLDHILGRYPVKSIRSGYIVGPWKKVKAVIGGREISLHKIEHDVLRKQFADPRLHYAINCASIGCPNLLNRAWTATTLEADLTATARAYINHPRGVEVLENGVRLSKIFKWFKKDFGVDKTALLRHLQAYADPELNAHISLNPQIHGYIYDWDLNNVETPK